MLLISLKSLKGKFILLMAAVVAVVIVCTVLSASENTAASPADGSPDYSAATQDDITSFINQLGLTVKSEPDSITQVLIPSEFDDVYTNYNELQKQAGLDLSPYKGCTAKRWTYTVSNYPEYENSNTVRLNILVYNGRIIGGDICSVELDGFMHSLAR